MNTPSVGGTVSFDEEWARLEESARERQGDVAMRLNQTEDGSYHPGRAGQKVPEQEAPAGGFMAQTTKLLGSSWRLVGLRDLTYDAVTALVTELGEQSGMAGDDDAGHAFAKVYAPAASTVVDKLSFASVVMSSGANALLSTAEQYLSNENRTAARFLDASRNPYNGVAAQPARPQCTPGQSRSGEELPDVIGETSGVHQYVLNGRFRGDPEKLRKVAETWHTARGLMLDAYWGAEGAWRDANLGHEGLTADAVNNFFALFVGTGLPPDKPHAEEQLLTNLPGACSVLRNACRAYADHIESARFEAGQDWMSEGSGPVWEWPVFGGNGQDGGLHGKVSGDGAIMELGSVGHALDSAQARVQVPQPDGGSGVPGVPGIPGIPPFIRVPSLVPAGYRPVDPNEPRRRPIPPPTPRDPRFPPLDPTERGTFRTWLNSLREGGISGGKPAEVAYQKRIAGYPEYEVPIPPGLAKGNTLMVDGVRPSDGMAVEAKYVRKPNHPCYRSLEALRENHRTGKRDFLFDDDRDELEKYAAALKDPRNQELRGVEVVTNNRDSVPYWRVMMAARGVKGYARYVP